MVEAGRQLWNEALAHRKRRWEEKRLSTSYHQQSLILTTERRANPLFRGLYSQAGQEILHRLDRAFAAFFEYRARYPRFKKFSQVGSFTYPQAYKGSVKPDVVRRRLFLPKVGNVKAVFHRGLPSTTREKLKTCTVVREPNGEWYASLVYDEDEGKNDGSNGPQSPQTKQFFLSPVGVDLGLKSLIATSDGTKIPHPHFIRKAEERLKRLKRKFSRTRIGSENRGRARRLFAVQSSRVARQRKELNHKLSTDLVRDHDLIAFEDLKIRNMVRNHVLAKSIADAGWGQFRRFTEYKGTRAGKLVIKVLPAYSTQECCLCGALNQVPLSLRSFACRDCKKMLDRDFNAATIVLKRGLAQVGQDTPQLKPVETGPLPVPTTGRASPIGEAGTIRDGNHGTEQEPSLEAHGFSRGRMSLNDLGDRFQDVLRLPKVPDQGFDAFLDQLSRFLPEDDHPHQLSDLLNLADAEPEPCYLIRPDPSAVVDDDVRLLQPLGEELQSLGVVIEQDLMGLRVTLSRSPHLHPQCVEALPESL